MALVLRIISNLPPKQNFIKKKKRCIKKDTPNIKESSFKWRSCSSHSYVILASALSLWLFLFLCHWVIILGDSISDNVQSELGFPQHISSVVQRKHDHGESKSCMILILKSWHPNYTAVLSKSRQRAQGQTDHRLPGALWANVAPNLYDNGNNCA